MKNVSFTLKIKVKTDPTDSTEMENDLAIALQEIIEAGELMDFAEIDEDEDEDEDEDY